MTRPSWSTVRSKDTVAGSLSDIFNLAQAGNMFEEHLGDVYAAEVDEEASNRAKTPDQTAHSLVSDEGEVEQEQEESPVDSFVYTGQDARPDLKDPLLMMVPFGRLTLRPDYGPNGTSYLEQPVPCADQAWQLPI